MATIRDLRSFIVPTWAQGIASLAVALVYLGLTFHDALTRLITGATNTKPAYFQQSYQDQINAIGNLSFTKEITIGIFWAGVGIIGYFVIITAVNLIIALRNEVIIDKMYADSGGLPSHFVEPIVRLALIVFFALTLLITLNALIPSLWLPLFGNLLLSDALNVTYFIQAIVAVLGLAFNFYLLGLLVLAIKNTDQFL